MFVRMTMVIRTNIYTCILTQVMPGQIGIHPTNKHVDSLFNHHVHWWGSHIVQFQWARDLIGASIPIAEEDGDSGDIEDFNNQHLNRGPLQLCVKAKYGAITCARACVFLACIAGEVPCKFESISVDGKMSKMKIYKQAPWIADMVQNGISFMIIKRKAKLLYPHLATRFQHAFIDKTIDHRIPQLSVLFELLELGRTPHNTWETAKAQVANMTGDVTRYKGEIDHMAAFASEYLHLRGIYIGDVLGPVIKRYVHASHAKRVMSNFWKALAGLRGPSTADFGLLPFLATALLSAQIACGEAYVQQDGVCGQLQPRHVKDVMKDKSAAFTWDRQLETAVRIALQLNVPGDALGQSIGLLFVKAGRIAANVHREGDSRHNPENVVFRSPPATIDGVCWQFVEGANHIRRGGLAMHNPFKCERWALADEPVSRHSEGSPPPVRKDNDVTPIEIGCIVQHTDGTRWQVINTDAETDYSGGPDGRLVLEEVLSNGMTDPSSTRSCVENELSEYHKVATKSDNLGADATHSERLQLAFGTSTIVIALRMGLRVYPHPNTRIESMPCPKVIACADYPEGTLRMIYASALVEPVDSWHDTDVVCRIIGVENDWGVVDGYSYKVVPMSDPLFKCDVWHMNTTPDDELANMQKRELRVWVRSRNDEYARDHPNPQTPIESASIVCVPMLCNTRDVKAGDQLFCKSIIGVPRNHDTGDAPRATLGVSAEYPVPVSITAAGHQRNFAFPHWGSPKRRRIE